MNAPLPPPALEAIRAHEAEMVEIRHQIHANPELAYEEHATSDLVAERLTRALGTEVPVLGRIPFDPRLREGGDSGHPLVIDHPEAPASQALKHIAQSLASRPRGLAGVNLNISPA